MIHRRLAVLLLMLLPAYAGANEEIPRGILPDTATPLAYRLNLTVVPERERFSGHAEIDVQLKAPTHSLFLHGRGLDVSRVHARVDGRRIRATYREVESSGVARLDFKHPLAAGKATLVFDYDAAFGDSASGLYRVKVAGEWYAWTQFQSIDARAAFPGFDQPGYKTPFTVSLSTRSGDMAISNAPEIGTERHGKLVKHNFDPTRPLPTYLMAFVVGPFASVSGVVPPNAYRSTPLPVRIVGTQPYADRLDFALRNTVPIVELLEQYFGSAFPFPKLDQIGSPVMPGAMENAGADIYGDSILLFGEQAPVRQKLGFGTVVSHELAHQWFGDLVTPAWWDDIWLNESFANWMGYRIGNEWRPDLGIGAAALDEGFFAMDTDALQAGRPIHQPIATNGEIDSAFDQVTYGKGGHIVAMVAAYLGDERFRAGVQLHMERHGYGTATTEQFFDSLAHAAGDARVLAALKSFVNQQGVPVIRMERKDGELALSQQRYGLYGTRMPQQQWIIPLCVRSAGARNCSLLDTPTASVPLKDAGAFMPNAGGTGYYRFSLAEKDWRALIAEAPGLSPGEALALNDSLWAGFQAGEVAPSLLLDAARAMRGNAYSLAAVEGGRRLANLRRQGLLPAAESSAYRAFVAGTWGQLLPPLGFDPRVGKHAADAPERQQLRSYIVSLLAGEARDAGLQSRLAAAASARLAGDASALDDTFLGDGLRAYVALGGEAAWTSLFERAVTSDETLFRRTALRAVGSVGSVTAGRWLLGQLDDERLRSGDLLTLLAASSDEPETRQIAFDWMVANYERLVSGSGIFVASTLPSLPSGFCSVEAADRVEAALRPMVLKHERGELELDRSVEQVRSCGLLRAHRQADLEKLFR
jgi:aminopeptidase N